MSDLEIATGVIPERWRPGVPGDRDRDRRGRGGMPTLIVGGGAAARTLIRDLRRSPDYGLRPLACLDDDPRLRSVSGLPVLGRPGDLRRIVREHGFEAVVVAIPSLPPARSEERRVRAECSSRW